MFINKRNNIYMVINMDSIVRTNTLPIIPMRGRVIFPDIVTSIDIGRDVSLKAAERSAFAICSFFCAHRKTLLKRI